MPVMLDKAVALAAYLTERLAMLDIKDDDGDDLGMQLFAIGCALEEDINAIADAIRGRL